jgi:hypothetical protein
MESAQLVEQVLLYKAVLILFRVRSGRVRSDDGNTDNRANSAQVQLNLPTRAELGNNTNKLV